MIKAVSSAISKRINAKRPIRRTGWRIANRRAKIETKWARQDSNLGPRDYESPALTAELQAHHALTREHPIFNAGRPIEWRIGLTRWRYVTAGGRDKHAELYESGLRKRVMELVIGAASGCLQRLLRHRRQESRQARRTLPGRRPAGHQIRAHTR